MSSKQKRIMVWTGASGKKYEYTLYGLDAEFNNVAGNYVFAQEVEPRTWKAVYVGQTDDLGRRLANHEKKPCVRRHGGTHVHVHGNATGESARREEESDLIKALDPVCNKQG